MIPDELILESFDGVARLFPLPNLVLFPHVIQGLHLFEPRYRQLAADSTESDGLFAMAVLKPGWESSYEGAPTLHEVICLGHIQRYVKIPDGRYEMSLRGISRAKIIHEVESNKLYRTAQVELIPEDRPDDVTKLTNHRKRLSQSVLARFDPASETRRQLAELFAGETPLGHVCDLLAYALPIPIEIKYQMLATPGVWDRVEILINELGEVKTPISRSFPPAFSAN